MTYTHIAGFHWRTETQMKQQPTAPDNANDATQARCVFSGSQPYTAISGALCVIGVSAETVGATSISLGVITMLAGQRTKAHSHPGHESAAYMLSGEEVELWTGPRLERREAVRPRDYLFLAAGMPHVVVNRSGTPAVFFVTRNDARTQEDQLPLPELDALVP